MKVENCSIEGCDATVTVARGWCERHYNRWKRHGDPTKIVKLRGEAIKYLHEVVFKYEGDECLTWPFTQNGRGYGWVSYEGKGYGVHYLACVEANGPRPSPKHHAAHTCGRGAQACCAKSHMAWKTPKENEADKVVHGTSARGENQGSHKLTETKVRGILAFQGVLPAKDLAVMYKVGEVQIRRIWSRQRWAWLLP